MTNALQWGILGTGNIAKALAKGIAASDRNELVAVGSRSQASADEFAAAFNVPTAHPTYDALLADPNVQAIYIATPHPFHAEWAIRCAEAGKHILCEKPLTLNYGQAMAVIEAARRNKVFLMEAFMYRCNPVAAKLVELCSDGTIGEVRMMHMEFGFDAGEPREGHRLFSNELAGGGILDVGCYCTSFARLLAGAETGKVIEPISFKGEGYLNELGTDSWAGATLKFETGFVAQIACSIQINLRNELTVYGSKGRLVCNEPWFATGHQGGSYDITIHLNGEEPKVITVQEEKPLYTLEVDTVADAIAAGKVEATYPAVTWDDTLGNMKALDLWRDSFKFVYEQEKTENQTTPVNGRPLKKVDTARMTYGRIKHLDQDVSHLVMGVDNHADIRINSVIYDDFIEQGGNTFDTAHCYGVHRSKVLGQYIKNRGIREQVNVIAKGIHTPNCYPEYIHKELDQQLGWLDTDYCDIYFMHRDNLDIPVSEFVDALNEEITKGRTKAFGGSNWSLERIAEANAYAEANGKQGFSATSNNLSLALMVDPVWGGCTHISDQASLNWYEENQIANFAWSSQARGFFVEDRFDPNNLDAAEEELKRCWMSDENLSRRVRAEKLAKEFNVRPINIALAYVLAQPFPSFALIGPRTMNETWTSLPGLDVKLSPEQVRYLANG